MVPCENQKESGIGKGKVQKIFELRALFVKNYKNFLLH